ncbi:hypothetical protein [Telluribacter sp.]|jgi:hypothetical protein|uniref:hypothetical protein n=1 Tax=Telluribacter sp. TaxID=1978767 RepID=UPI002E0F97FD|nr:hypothetical protein [Telluribacter sp.]
MKTFLISAFALVLSVTTLFAQNDKYTQAMTTTLETLNQQENKQPDQAAFLELANRFERIAAAEPTEWLPRYYAAYCNTRLGVMDGEASLKEQRLDKAEALLKEADTLPGKAADELEVLWAFVAQARLAIDPMSRWQTYGPVFGEHVAAAKVLNPNNPRIYVLEGTNLFYTPEQFGGGKKVAKPVLEKALEKFATFQSPGPLHPQWGKGQAAWMAAQ